METPHQPNSLQHYRLLALKNYPIAIPDKKVMSWYKSSNLTWNEFADKFSEPYMSKFGLQDYRPFPMLEPVVKGRIAADYVKSEWQYYFYGTNEPGIRYVFKDKTLSEEDRLTRIQLDLKIYDIQKTNTLDWVCYDFPFPEINWGVVFYTLLEKGFPKSKIKNVIKDFKKGEDYTLHIPLKRERVLEFITNQCKN